MLETLPEPVLGSLRKYIRNPDLISLSQTCTFNSIALARFVRIAVDVLRNWEVLRKSGALGELEN